MKTFLSVVLVLFAQILPGRANVPDSILAEIKKAGADSGRVSKLKVGLGTYYFKEGSFDSALLLLDQSASIARKSNDHLTLLQALNNMGNVYADKGNNKEALDYYQKALSLGEETGLIKETGEIQKNIGALYVSLKRFDEAIVFYEKAKTIAIKYGNQLLEADCYNNIGIIYEQQFKYSSALDLYKKALDFYTKSGNKSRVAMALSNVAIVYKFLKKYPQAIEYNLKGLALAREMQSQWTEAAILNNIGSIYSISGHYDSAIKYCNMSIALSRKMDAMEIVYNAYETMGEAATVAGDYKSAVGYYKQFYAAKDSFGNAESNRELSALNAKYETARKDKQLAAQSFELTKRNYLLLVISILLISGGIISFGFYKRYKSKKEKQLQDEVIRQQDLAVKAVLQAEENERKRIAGELHDGVGQMMSAARMNLSAFEDELQANNEGQKQRFDKIISLVDESCKEVRMVSHNMMPNALLKSGLANAVRDFVEKIDTRVIKVDLYSEGLQERLDANTETVLYRVIQECVNNVIKHSQANHLDITLIKQQGTISVTIEDNGIGFDISQLNHFEGIGLKNIVTRVQYLKGEVEFNSANGKGTLIAIYVPIVGS